jgi:heterodisulfide reductase subunit A
LHPKEKRVLVVGGGVAGLSAAHALARGPVTVDLVEKAPALGGHAIQYACKATDACVKCGACLAESARNAAESNPNIRKWLETTIASASAASPFRVTLSGADGEALAGASELAADAVIVATGFSPFAPTEKPYGWGRFPNVITNLELEQRLRKHGAALRPSDGEPAEKLAFIQCVGSRDASLGHLWCSKVCCGSALRMARLIQSRRPDTEVHFFYIDVQTFGKDFQTFYDDVRAAVRMVRIIPADVIPLEADRLQISYFDPDQGQGIDEAVDLLVLSIGMLPGQDTGRLSEWFGLARDDNGFLDTVATGKGSHPEGVFPAGAATGPMSIAESIASGQQAAWQALNYLSGE